MVSNLCGRGLLAYSVTLFEWKDVAKVLREFKKKKHSEFYLEILEVAEGYHVFVYRN